MSNRIWVIITAVFSLAVLALGFLLGVQPRLNEIGANAVELANSEMNNVSQEARLAALKKQYEEIDELRAELAILRSSVPTDTEFAAFIRQLESTATNNSSVVTNFAASAGEAYTEEEPEPPAAPSGDTDAAEGDTPATEADAEAPTAAVGAVTLIGLPVAITAISGDADSLFNFLSDLRTGSRLFAVVDFAFNVTVENGAVIYTLVVNGHIYSILDPNATEVSESEPEAPVEEPAKTEDDEEMPTPAPTETTTP